MPLILNGTTGVSGIDGSAGTPSYQGGDTNTGIFYPAADTIAFAEGGAEIARFDSSGNLGIGTTSPSNRLSVVTASGSDGFISVTSPTTETAGVSINGGTSSNKGAIVRFQKNASTKWTIGTDSGIIGGTSDNFHLYGGGADAMLFSTNATERMRITSGGNLLVNTTGNLTFAGRLQVDNSGENASSFRCTTNNFPVVCHNTTTVGTRNLIYFATATSTNVGTITSDGTGTNYNSNSDYRLKENIEPMTGALAKVSQLKPCTYTWKSNGSAGQGFIAHELQAVVPDAVVGEKDAVDKDGNPVYQGIDTSFLVATLTAAIQEQQVMIEELKAKVAALEK